MPHRKKKPILIVVTLLGCAMLLFIILKSLDLLSIDNSTPAKVKLRPGSDNNVKLSGNDLTFFHKSNDGEDALALATRAHGQGKWYFEMTFLCRTCGGKDLTAIPDVGIYRKGAKKKRRPGDLVGQDIYFYGLPVSKETFLDDGDVIGVAMDLDAWRVHFSINGVWIINYDRHRNIAAISDPFVYGAGLPVKPNVEYLAAAFIEPKSGFRYKDGWQANFGHRPFVYPIPPGFAAYDGSRVNGDQLVYRQNPIIKTLPDKNNASVPYRVHTVCNINTYTKNKQKWPCTVKITDKKGPLVLVCHSDAPVVWNIEKSDGVDIQAMYLFGHRQSEVSGIATEKIHSTKRYMSMYAGMLLNKSKRYAAIELMKIIDTLTRKFNVPPATIQVAKKADAFTVDGDRSIQMEIAYFASPPETQPVLMMPVTPCCLNLTDGNLKMSHSGQKIPNYRWADKYFPAKAKTNAMYNTGKWYFETIYCDGDGQADRSPKTNIGVVTRFTINVALHSDGPGYTGHSYGLIRKHEKIKDGDLIGVALDLDNWKVNYHINGRWRYGDPGKKLRGKRLQPYRAYYAAFSAAHPVSAEKSDAWIANFGATPFVYQMPDGYRPYGK
jgi:hypothetical protein